MTLVRRMVLLCAMLSSPLVHANDQWRDDLLGLAGTSVVYDNPEVQLALQQNQTPDLGNILQQAGMRPWAGARIWLVQQVNNTIQPYAVSQALLEEANHRGLMLNTMLNNDSQALLQQTLSQAKTHGDDIRKLIHSQQSDALLVLTSQNNQLRWQLFNPPLRSSGSIGQEAAKYLPHIWSENLALSWQWPQLGSDSLVRIDGIHALVQFKAAETALASACTAVRVLRVAPDSVDFACRSTNSQMPDKLNLIPQLVAKPVSSLGLSTEILMGRQLTQRFARFQWRTDIY